MMIYSKDLGQPLGVKFSANHFRKSIDNLENINYNL